MEQLDKSKYLGWKLVGEGGYAKVYKAFDKDQGIDVAIKEIAYSKTNFDVYDMDRMDEITALQSIDEYVPQYYGYWVDDTPGNEYTYIVQEFIYGQTVEELYYDEEDNDRELTDGDWERLWIIAGKLLEAVSYINEIGWIHGDLSPSNLMWTGTDLIVIDLGMATRENKSRWDDVSMVMSTIKNAAQIVVGKDDSLHPVQDRIRMLRDYYNKNRGGIDVSDLLNYYRDISQHF